MASSPLIVASRYLIPNDLPGCLGSHHHWIFVVLCAVVSNATIPYTHVPCPDKALCHEPSFDALGDFNWYAAMECDWAAALPSEEGGHMMTPAELTAFLNDMDTLELMDAASPGSDLNQPESKRDRESQDSSSSMGAEEPSPIQSQRKKLRYPDHKRALHLEINALQRELRQLRDQHSSYHHDVRLETGNYCRRRNWKCRALRARSDQAHTTETNAQLKKQTTAITSFTQSLQLLLADEMKNDERPNDDAGFYHTLSEELQAHLRQLDEVQNPPSTRKRRARAARGKRGQKVPAIIPAPRDPASHTAAEVLDSATVSDSVCRFIMANGSKLSMIAPATIVRQSPVLNR